MLWKSGKWGGFCGLFAESEGCGDFLGIYVGVLEGKKGGFWVSFMVGEGCFWGENWCVFGIKIEQLCGKLFGRKW